MNDKIGEKIDARTLASAFARRLAAYNVNDEVVSALAQRVANAGLKPIDFDLCHSHSHYHLCIDYRVSRPKLDDLLKRLELDHTIRELRILPQGIPTPDEFRVRVQYFADAPVQHHVNMTMPITKR